jgi:radical SAM protein with 4Fe4S-binding SPASM domain
MSSETMSQIVNKLTNIEKKKLAEKIVLRLAGGEPLLVFNNWKGPIVDFINNSSNQSCVNIISNLTYLPPGFLDFLHEQERININVSLDGLKMSKPYANGKSSSEDVINNLKKIEKDVYILSVISENSYNELPELAEYIAEKQYSWRVSIDYFYSGSPKPELIIEKLKATIDVLAKHKYPMRKFKLDHCDFNGCDEGCTAGEKLFSINTNGDLFPCHTLFSSNPIGNINDGNDLIQTLHSQKCYKIGTNHEWDEECKNCSAFIVCHGDCQLYNKGARKKPFCQIVKSFLISYTKQYLKELY